MESNRTDQEPLFLECVWHNALLYLRLRPFTTEQQRKSGFSFSLADAIFEAALDQAPSALIVDATPLRTASDALISALLYANSELPWAANAQQPRICIVGPRPSFVKTWQKRDLNALFHLVSTEPDAYRFFGVEPPRKTAVSAAVLTTRQTVATSVTVSAQHAIQVKAAQASVVVDDIKTFIARQNGVLLLALVICLAYHMTLSFYTYTRTYDAFVHIFFGDHYSRWWWDPFDPRWYTGFSLTSYPPGSQQTIGLLSKLVGLGNGFVIAQTGAMLNCTIGIYRFSKIWVSEEAAGYAAMLFVFSSAITETVHVFGQLPTTFSLGFLLNALPFVYRWIKEGEWHVLLQAISLNAATTAGHHVTTLFGAVFFVAPVMGLALMEKLREPLPNEPWKRPSHITRSNLRPLIMRRLRRLVPAVFRSGIYGPGLILVLLFVVLPYWLWSRADPITQVSIPHASRDSFIENTAAGLVFWLVPYGVTLPLLPYVVYKGYFSKAWPMAMSWSMLFFLGTGGTTPFPRMLLGGAFDILTLDRFTFWATMTQLPLLGEFVVSMRHGRFARYLKEQFGHFTWRTLQVLLVISYVGASIWVANLTRFRKFQPAPIDIEPIVNFINKDEHWRWRYLTLGFGDQVAWLSAHTTANMIDGNYHSARRLPELTTTPVERLEGAKYSGLPGLGSLQQILATPDKYSLKFVYSNDQFYDPLLFFYGWHRLGQLENGIMVWERADIPPLPEVLPRKETPVYQRVMWGIVPYSALIAGVLALSAHLWGPLALRFLSLLGIVPFVQWLDRRVTPRLPTTPRQLFYRVWYWLDGYLIRWSQMDEAEDDSDVVRWQTWVDWVQLLPNLSPPVPRAYTVRTALIVAIGLVSASIVWVTFNQSSDDPVRMVEAYYDDLDFRRMEEAYAALDPQSRPSFDLYLLNQSVTNGLLASYGKLDNIFVTVVEAEIDGRMKVEAHAQFITAMAAYQKTFEHVLVKRDGKWHIVPDPQDIRIPPDTFFRKGSVDWHVVGRRRISEEDTSHADIIDRPELQILSAQLVRVNDNWSVVGELINLDADPADVTLAAYMYGDDANLLSWYNAHLGMIHKLFPKEVTPFRIDFEGVSRDNLLQNTPIEFEPDSFFPIDLDAPAASFALYAQGVVTTLDLYRDVGIQEVTFYQDEDGVFHLSGELYNVGTQEATIPHIFVTYYDENNEVVWVDDYFVPESVRPQRLIPVDFTLTPGSAVDTFNVKGDNYANSLAEDANLLSDWIERVPAPEGLGYHSLRIAVHYFVGIPK